MEIKINPKQIKGEAMITKQIIKTGWELLLNNYGGDVDLGSTEYSIIGVGNDNYLLIPGTNETLDWKENFNLTSENGIKKVGVDAMEDILKHFEENDMSLSSIDYIFCHSKSAPSGVSFAKHGKRMGYKYKVIAFNPARSVRRSAKIELDNLTLFRNRFDPVSELLGFVNFSHPKCKTYFNWSYHHLLKYWGKYFNNMKE